MLNTYEKELEMIENYVSYQRLRRLQESTFLYIRHVPSGHFPVHLVPYYMKFWRHVNLAILKNPYLATL